MKKEAVVENEEKETVYRLMFTPREDRERPARYAAIEVDISDPLNPTALRDFVVTGASGSVAGCNSPL